MKKLLLNLKSSKNSKSTSKKDQLQQLLDLVDSESSKYGTRYPESVKDISLYFYITGGRSVYETLYANSTIPCSRTVQDHHHKSFYRYDEGIPNIKPLSEYVKNNNCSKFLVLSEDGSKLTENVTYCCRTNKIYGLKIPLGPDGLPVPDYYIVDCAEKMRDQIDNCQLSSYVYVMMAKSLTPNSTPFCLLAFGTDNTFTAEDVLNRWKTVNEELQKHDLEAIGKY
jgi:hypothetical protein